MHLCHTFVHLFSCHTCLHLFSQTHKTSTQHTHRTPHKTPTEHTTRHPQNTPQDTHTTHHITHTATQTRCLRHFPHIASTRQTGLCMQSLHAVFASRQGAACTKGCLLMSPISLSLLFTCITTPPWSGQHCRLSGNVGYQAMSAGIRQSCRLSVAVHQSAVHQCASAAFRVAGILLCVGGGRVRYGPTLFHPNTHVKRKRVRESARAKTRESDSKREPG